MIHTRTTQTLVFILAVAVLSSVIGYGMVFSFLRSKAVSVSQRGQELESLSLQQQQLSSLQALVDDTETDRARLASYFVTEDTAADFIAFLEGLGGAPTTITGVSARVPREVGEVGELSVSLIAEGSWARVMQTLGLLESAPYALSIQTVRLASLEQAAAEGEVAGAVRWTATIALDIQMIVSEK